jgi:tRNA/tmRNA/rRNA uracil-C5-methylase (TrmA/RlmC/RlmD family)
VTDVVRAHDGRSFTVRHHARSFFQGNRYLLQALVDDVASRIGAARVADLYAGVGLFARRLVADGRQVEAVESDRQAALDLADNARGVSGFTAHHRTVEQFVARGGLTRVAAVIVDPPRAGMGPVVVESLAQSGLSTIVYVSCDPATLARDVRRLASVGYTPRDVRAFDLFPRTGHVEVVVTLTR